MSIIGIIATIVYKRTAGSTTSGIAIILLAWLILSAGIIANVYAFTAFEGGTDAAPVLHNVDALRNWNDSLWMLRRGGVAAPPNYGLFPVFAAAMMLVFGTSITAALLPQMAFTLGTLICVSRTTYALTGSTRTARLALLGTAAVCYLMASGMILVKDAAVIFAMSLFATSLFAYPRPRLPILATAAVLAALTRPPMALLMMLGVCSWAVAEKPTAKRLRQCIVPLTICAVAFGVSKIFAVMPVLSLMADGVITAPHNITSQQAAYFAFTGDYTQYTPIMKFALLPISAAVQFLIPFPWNFLRDIPYGFSQTYAHFAYPWYAFGAVAMFAAISPRRISRATWTLLVWGIICWIAPCYSTAGTVSRYALPAVPLMATAVAETLLQPIGRRKLWIWLTVFVIILTGALLAAHRLQSAYA